MNISEHLSNFVATELNCKHVFTLTGGGSMFLNDAFGNNNKIKSIYCHHEQAAAMAAVAYSKLNNIGTCITTTGCGATNALTGLLDAWQDNTPVLFISGQVKLKETSYSSDIKLRAFGVQEFNIIPVVKSFTKASIFIDSFDTYYKVIKSLKFHLLGERPGPVWLDIPMDIQSIRLSPDQINKLSKIPNTNISYNLNSPSESIINSLSQLISKSERPVILVGNGLRLSQLGKGIDITRNIASKHKIPIVSTYLGVDFYKNEEEFYFGTIGLKASRAANIILGNTDLLICIGSRLATSAIGFEYEDFAKNAKKIVIDIDSLEHRKKTITIDLFIESDAVEFLKSFEKIPMNNYSNWLKRCIALSEILPIQEQFSPKNKISIYDAVKHICKYSNENDILVSDAGSSYYVSSIMFNKYKNQRYITSGAQADMGFGLPAGIGSCFAKLSKSRVHVITGDGSFQLNLQELQTVVTFQLDLTIYILNNNGYLSIRSTQNNFFKGRECGTDSSNGVTFPNLRKISNAYGINYKVFNKEEEFTNYLEENKHISGPLIVELICPENEQIIPRTVTQKDSEGKLKSAPLTIMAPLLEAETEERIKELGFKI